MTAPFDGNAAAPEDDRLLHKLQEEQQKGCSRARRLMKDYREFMKAREDSVRAFFTGKSGPEPLVTDEA